MICNLVYGEPGTFRGVARTSVHAPLRLIPWASHQHGVGLTCTGIAKVEQQADHFHLEGAEASYAILRGRVLDKVDNLRLQVEQSFIDTQCCHYAV